IAGRPRRADPYAMCAEAGGRECDTDTVGAPCTAACSAQTRLEQELGLDLARRLMRALLPLPQDRRGSSSPRMRTKRKTPNPATPAITREIALVQPIATPPRNMHSPKPHPHPRHPP